LTFGVYLGVFADQQDAIKARKEAELKYYGQYAAVSELEQGGSTK